MKLVERISSNTAGAPAPQRTMLGTQKSRVKDSLVDSSRELKQTVQKRLLETMDVTKLDGLEPAVASEKVTAAISTLLDEQGRVLTGTDRARLIDEIKNELLGVGPLEPLLRDDRVTDILVNGHRHVYVEREGKLYPTNVTFEDDHHLLTIIERIVSQVGRRVDESSPMVDARLPDGSRVNAIIPPLAIDGPALSIRRFGAHRYNIMDLVKKGSLTQTMASFLDAIVRARLNIIVAGGTGSGKTTMLNCLSAFIPDNERIVTIEDSAELCLQQPHVVRLETRTANVEGKGEVTQRELVKNCLRMRPDRIVVGDLDHPRQQRTRKPQPPGDDDAAVGHFHSAARDAPADRLGRQHHRPRQPPVRRHAQGDEDLRGDRDGRRGDHDAGPVRVCPHRRQFQRQGAGDVPPYRHPLRLRTSDRGRRVQAGNQALPG